MPGYLVSMSKDTTRYKFWRGFLYCLHKGILCDNAKSKDK